MKPSAAPSSSSSPQPSSLLCWGGHQLLPVVSVGPAGFSVCPSVLHLPATAPGSSPSDLPSQTGALFIPLSCSQPEHCSPRIPAGPRPRTHKEVTVPLVLAQQAGWKPGNPSSSGLCKKGGSRHFPSQHHKSPFSVQFQDQARIRLPVQPQPLLSSALLKTPLARTCHPVAPAAHLVPCGGNEVQAVFLHIVHDGEGEFQDILQRTNTG